MFSGEEAAPVINPSGEIEDAEIGDAWGEGTGESVGDLESGALFPETDPVAFAWSRKSMYSFPNPVLRPRSHKKAANVVNTTTIIRSTRKRADLAAWFATSYL